LNPRDLPGSVRDAPSKIRAPGRRNPRVPTPALYLPDLDLGMLSCPRCQREVIEGAYGCAACGYVFPPKPRGRPLLWPVALGGAAGLVLGSIAGVRWGGFAVVAAVPAFGVVGLFVGALAGAAITLGLPPKR
jgi:hypothetical protein